MKSSLASLCSLFALASLVAACGDDGGSSRTPTCEPGTFCACTTDSNCPTGEVCGAQQFCVAGGGDTSDVVEDTTDTVNPDPDVVEDTDTQTDADTTTSDADTVSDVADVEPDADDADTQTDVADADVTGDVSADTTDGATDTTVEDTTPPIEPIVNPWVAFTTEALFDVTLPDGSERPIEDVLLGQIMLTRQGESFALHVDTGDQIQTSPVWSPDGQSLAFLAGPANARALKIIDLETTEITTVTASLPVNPASLCWSRDGQTIVVDAFPFGTTNTSIGLDLFAVSVGSGELVNLTNSPNISENTPRCLPDGRVYFVRTDDGRTSILRMPVTGGSTEVLAGDTGIGGTIGVTPDGLFAFANLVEGESIFFVRVDLTTGEVTRLSDNNRGSIDVALDGSFMIGLAVLSDNQVIVPLNPFTAAITGARLNTQPEASRHPGIDINPRPRISAPAVAPVSGDSVIISEDITGGGT
jgi:hypothetical protein